MKIVKYEKYEIEMKSQRFWLFLGRASIFHQIENVLKRMLGVGAEDREYTNSQIISDNYFMTLCSQSQFNWTMPEIKEMLKDLVVKIELKGGTGLDIWLEHIKIVEELFRFDWWHRACSALLCRTSLHLSLKRGMAPLNIIQSTASTFVQHKIGLVRSNV